MAYHEAFWATIGASAPVITLAWLVVPGQTLKWIHKEKRRLRRALTQSGKVNGAIARETDAIIAEHDLVMSRPIRDGLIDETRKDLAALDARAERAQSEMTAAQAHIALISKALSRMTWRSRVSTGCMSLGITFAILPFGRAIFSLATNSDKGFPVAEGWYEVSSLILLLILTIFGALLDDLSRDDKAARRPGTGTAGR
jgi:hypothetical protein